MPEIFPIGQSFHSRFASSVYHQNSFKFGSSRSRSHLVRADFPSDFGPGRFPAPHPAATEELVRRDRQGRRRLSASVAADGSDYLFHRRIFTVTATLILMTSAFVAGGDCGGCAAPAASCCDPCARVSMMDKMRARMALHKSKKADNCCDPCAKPAPTCCAPAPAPAPVCCPAPAPACPTECDPCAKPSLLDRLRARFHKKNDCCEPVSDCCGAAPAHPGAPALPGTPGAPATPAAPAPKPIPPTGKTTQHDAPSQIVPTSGNSF
jgi:hypothetical protein